jgi:hypothetical protein
MPTRKQVGWVEQDVEYQPLRVEHVGIDPRDWHKNHYQVRQSDKEEPKTESKQKVSGRVPVSRPKGTDMGLPTNPRKAAKRAKEIQAANDQDLRNKGLK